MSRLSTTSLTVTYFACYMVLAVPVAGNAQEDGTATASVRTPEEVGKVVFEQRRELRR